MRKFYFLQQRGLSLYLAVIFMVCCLTAHAEKVSYPDSWGQQGVTLKSQNSSGVSINFSLKEFTFEDRMINGESMKEIGFSGNFLQNDEGAPNLPSISRYIAIPQGATAQLEIVRSRTEVMQNLDIAPAPKIPLDTYLGPLQYHKNMSIYSANAPFPGQPVILSQITQLRGVDVVMVSITPYQYNPVTKKLVIFRDIEVKVNFTGGNGHFGDDRLRSRFWDPILKDNVFNSESLPIINYAERFRNAGKSPETGCEYLIIVPTNPEFKQWADSVSAFRTEQGILTKIVTITEVGGNTSAAIDAYINNAYNTWSIPPAACLLMADHGTNPANSITSNILNDHPDGYNPYVSDNPYADVTGDKLPDIAFARMTANNFEQLQTMVTKDLSYERNPPTSAAFYDHPVTALGWQTERWFQLCSEIVGGFWKNVKGKHPVRVNAVYQGTPGTIWSSATNTNTVVSYFGPNGLGYIPTTPAELGGWDGGNATDINNALNAGAFMLQHRDHGNQTGWGEPSYQNPNISGLTNTDLSFIMSLNCQTGKFDYSSECFTEKFHRYKYNGQNAGALGLIAATEVSYSFVNDTYAWGMYDNMWTDFMPAYGAMFEERGIMPAFGNCAGKYFLQQSSWPYNTNNKEITYQLFHHHGDAFMTVNSEVPQQLTVSHAAVMINSATSFDVTADAGSFIALSANGQIIGSGNGTGSPVAIAVTAPAIGTIVKIVVTRQNYYRHYSSAIVISNENPYVLTDAFTVSDPAGNNNQALDFGEDAFLSLAEKNIGNNPALNVVVTLTLNDPYITLTDNSETYPLIPSQQSVTVENGFKVHIGNVPDGYQKLVTATATNGIDTWISHFTLQCRAPQLSAGMLLVDDSQGGNGNGRLDAGETAIIRIATTNTGTSAAPGVTAALSLSSGLITLNNNTSEIGLIAPSGSGYAEFNVSVSPDAPEGLSVDLYFTAVSGAYSTQHTYVIQSGLKVEDWETGDFNKYPWTSSGNVPWSITSVDPIEGVYAAKSGAIGNSQNSQLILTYNAPNNDSIKFYCKVSSEAVTDGLKFYIDNTLKASYSGSTSWIRAAFAVNAGNHAFKFIYTKNGSGSAGADCAWLDYIVLPLPQYTTSFAGVDTYLCEASTYQCNGNASNYSGVVWTTSGSGTFSDATILNPVYTPGTADLAAGSVTLTMTATGASGTSADEMLLTFQHPSTAFAGENADICSGLTYLSNASTASNYTQLHWTTSGTGFFADPSHLLAEYTPGAEDIAAGTVTLTLNASNQSCEAASSSKTLTIHTTPAPLVAGESMVCALTKGSVYSTPAGPGNTYTWTVNGGSIESGTGSSQVAINWGSEAGGSVFVTENTSHNCSASHTKAVVINPLPLAQVAGITTGCTGENTSYSTNLNPGHTYSWSINGGTITSGQGTNEIQVTWNNAGANSINLSETIDATLCTSAKTVDVLINNNAEVPAKPQGSADVDLLSAGNTDYTVQPAAWAQSYAWQILPAEAGIISGNSAGSNVVWNSSFRGNASISVKAINACAESAWSETFTVRVFSSLGIGDNPSHIGVNISPNPNDGNFVVSISTPGKVLLDMKISASNGTLVYDRKKIASNGNYSEALTLNLAQGTYTITVNTADGFVVKKFVVSK